MKFIRKVRRKEIYNNNFDYIIDKEATILYN